MNNAEMVRRLRKLNPGAKIIMTVDVLTDVPALYSAGADYVRVGRLDEAANLCAALEAADAGLLEKKRAQLDARLANRDEAQCHRPMRFGAVPCVRGSRLESRQGGTHSNIGQISLFPQNPML